MKRPSSKKLLLLKVLLIKLLVHRSASETVSWFIILSRDRVTIDGVWIGIRIY
jgi:hypothetical protein